VTAPKICGPASFTIDFGCDRRCQAEYDLEGASVRHTLGQMLAATERAHDEAHATEPVRTFRWGPFGEVVVRADVVLSTLGGAPAELAEVA
jgi:hypothetical protein